MSDMPTWNLEAVYATPEAWEEDFARLTPAAEAFAAFRGHLHEGAERLAGALAASDAFDRLAEKLHVYAHCRCDEDTTVNANRARLDRLETKFAELSALCAWFAPELLKIDDELMRSFLADPAVALHRRNLLELLRAKPHVLSGEAEELLGVFDDVLGASEKLFEILNDSDMDFGRLRDENGKYQPLTHGSYRRFLESGSRELRRRAFCRMHGKYRELRNTFAATLDGAVKHHVVSARVRHYDSALEQALFGDNVPVELYQNLIATVRSKLDKFHKYVRLRARAMGLEKLDMYDVYNPLLPELRRNYDFAAAREMLQGALAPLGGQYLKDMQKAFEQRWVDVPERKGKRSGAYSSGCFDTMPYMLLNYNGTLNDVFTLAHELGHSMHSFYSNASQPFQLADYRIFVAEVASTTNEILLFEHLLANSADRESRAFLLAHLADEIRGTIYRQTMFAEFELKIHQLAENSTPLTADLLCDIYYRLNADYYGEAMQADRLIAMEWARIPHFYYNFYVYKYATGMAAALKLAEGLRSGEPKRREDYLGFLRAGHSKDVLEIMRDAGADLSQPAPVAAALDYFGEVVDRLAAELGLSVE